MTYTTIRLLSDYMYITMYHNVCIAVNVKISQQSIILDEPNILIRLLQLQALLWLHKDVGYVDK